MENKFIINSTTDTTRQTHTNYIQNTYEHEPKNKKKRYTYKIHLLLLGYKEH